MPLFNRSNFRYRYDGQVFSKGDLIKRVYEDSLQMPENMRESFVEDILRSHNIRETPMTKSSERTIVYFTGIVFLLGMLLFSSLFPYPSPLQYLVCRIILSFSAAACVTFVPGFLQVEVSSWIRAGGALAAFLVVYFWSPAALGPTEIQLPNG